MAVECDLQLERNCWKGPVKVQAQFPRKVKKGSFQSTLISVCLFFKQNKYENGELFLILSICGFKRWREAKV